MGHKAEGSSPHLSRPRSHKRTASAVTATTDLRGNDRIVHYTMKTSGRTPSGSSHSHSQSNSQSFRQSKSSTPLSSPRMPHSVGQPYPPKLSPSIARVNAQDVRTPSPNYFGLIVEQPTDPRDSAVVPRENWSPPTSSVKSFAAALPKQLPLDANPEFAAFRRQADANKGRSGFSLSTASLGGPSLAAGVVSPATQPRPRPPTWHTHSSDSVSELPMPRLSPLAGRGRDASGNRIDVDSSSLHDSAYVSGDSKRSSQVSLNPPSFLSMTRHESPASIESPFTAPQERRLNLSAVDDKHPRLSLVEGKVDRQAPDPNKSHRADTVPPKLESGGPGMITAEQLKDLVERTTESELLLLDLRVSPQFGQSRIRGALNLCIPTTLLKRATFNLEKLQSTFHNEHDQSRFANWRKTEYLVVYDAFSSEKRDAVSAVNMVKKFTNEGYRGATYILRGGFNSFSAAYPQLIDHSAGNSAKGLSFLAGSAIESGRPSVAPVIGGVMLPTGTDNPNPFFSSIRQNVELANGVGQMELNVPAGLSAAILPQWLREATDTGDHGKRVSEKFLQIEKKEQSRMKDAYDVFKPVATSSAQITLQLEDKVRLSGVEKGVKNRYKDILPFEHARVRLQGRQDGACDYINASHIRARGSRKRYIASQGPLPATFEDFWSVIWDQDVRVIVMLTAESEGGQLKCHPYWKGRDYGPIKLRSVSEKKVSLDIDKHRSSSIGLGALGHLSYKSTLSSANSSNGNNGQNSSPSSSSYHAEFGRRRANTTTTIASTTPGPGHGGNQTNTPSNSSNGPSEAPYVIVRKFALTHDAHPFENMREITHLHYPSWPDFGAPAQPSHLLALVEIANVMQRAALPLEIGGVIVSMDDKSTSGVGFTPAGSRTTSRTASNSSSVLPLSWHDDPERDPHARPMLVHCSAGCGRTGTFCTVDTVIDMLKRQRVRAARVATRRIAERERRFATHLAVEREGRMRLDVDGDIEMSDTEDTFSGSGFGDAMDGSASARNEDSISPLDTTKQPQFPFPGLLLSDSDAGRGGRTPTARSPLLQRSSSGVLSLSTSDHRDGMGADVDEKEDDDGSDIDLAWLTDDSVDLVAATVGDFRTQRLSMVQSLRQFVLCYESIAEWIGRLQERGGGVAPPAATRTGGAAGGSRIRSGSLNVRT